MPGSLFPLVCIVGASAFFFVLLIVVYISASHSLSDGERCVCASILAGIFALTASVARSVIASEGAQGG